MIALRRAAVAVLLAGCATAVARSYSLGGASWRAGTAIAMQLQLGPSGTALIDGSDGWNGSAEAALARWNSVMSGVSFLVVRNSTAPIGSSNGVNNVIIADSYFGRPFSSETLAITLWSYRGSTFSEADVVFNNKWNWNSYRGALRRASSPGGTMVDLRRVALHEFGHVLGLDHPDEHGQRVTAQMNSTVGDLDDLADDDINGARALYGAPANRAPAATASCNPCTVRSLQSVTVSATGTDADNDPLSYQWAGAGTFASAGASTTTWIAPAQTGSIVLTVTVNDGRGGQSSATIAVQVLPGERLQAEDRLLPGQFLTAVNGAYRLQFQNDGNLVLTNLASLRAVWASGTVNARPGQAVMQSDGNLVITNDGTAVWSSRSAGSPGAFVALQGDGNVVVYNTKGVGLWSSGTVGF